jgi:hypothetical protein
MYMSRHTTAITHQNYMHRHIRFRGVITPTLAEPNVLVRYPQPKQSHPPKVNRIPDQRHYSSFLQTLRYSLPHAEHVRTPNQTQSVGTPRKLDVIYHEARQHTLLIWHAITERSTLVNVAWTAHHPILFLIWSIQCKCQSER